MEILLISHSLTLFSTFESNKNGTIIIYVGIPQWFCHSVTRKFLLICAPASWSSFNKYKENSQSLLRTRLSQSVGSIWECHHSVICCVDILITSWMLLQLLRSRLPTLQNHRRTGGDNAKHHDEREDEQRGRDKQKKCLNMFKSKKKNFVFSVRKYFSIFMWLMFCREVLK